jgi:hypothetical protein
MSVVLRVMRHGDSLRTIGGIAGLGGGLLVPVGAVFSSPAMFLLGLVLLVLCELALVVLLGRVSRVAAACAVTTLGLGVVIGAVGLTDLLLAPAFVAIGTMCWVVERLSLLFWLRALT